MAASQLPRCGCLSGRSNSEVPRCRRQGQGVYHRVHEDVVRRRCPQRHGTRSEDNKTRRTLPGQEMMAARLACLALAIVLFIQLDPSVGSKCLLSRTLSAVCQ